MLCLCFYVQADHDFSATIRYAAPDGTSMEKSLNVRLEGETEKPTDAYRVSTYEARPTPSVTTGKITAVKKVNGTWLLWFNGEEAYCCTHGAKGTPNGCPVYNYSHTSLVTAAQYTPGDHYTRLTDRLQGHVCEFCGAETEDIEIHHIRKLKDLSGKAEWERHMIARKRKTMTLCHSCHVKLHNGKLD